MLPAKYELVLLGDQPGKGIKRVGLCEELVVVIWWDKRARLLPSFERIAPAVS